MGDTSQIACNVNVKIENVINIEETNEINKNVSLDNVANKQHNKLFYTEVISIDDSDDENMTNENSNSATEPKFNQEDNSNVIATSSSAFDKVISNPLISENEKKFYIIYQHKLFTLTRETILKGIEEQAKSLRSKSDSILNIIIRTHHPEYYKHTRTVHENLIYNAIEYWKHWCETKTKLKTTPNLYKCYICNEGWQRLHFFEQHITIHKEKNLIVSLEEIGQEANVIATYGNPKKNNPVNVNSDCWKCFKTFQNREFIKHSMKSNTCESCQIQSTVGSHESTYKSLNYTRVLCTICYVYCNNEDIYSHMVLHHTPKSDEPAVTHTEICNLCDGKYFSLAYHDCPKRYKYYKCNFCWNRFQTKPLQKLHVLMNKGVSDCPDCSKTFTKCHLIDHLLLHSYNYDVLQYCISCKNNVLYNNNILFTSHMLKHSSYSDRRHYAAKMLLPFKCIKGVICDSVSILQVPAKILHKHLLDLDYMNYTPLELIDIIKAKKTNKSTEACGSKKERNTNKTVTIIKNKCRNLEQSDITKKLTKKHIIAPTVNNYQENEMEYDNESDNDAFQVQLDAEIQRDIEIEKQISKVIEESDCYKKFLDKEANDPMDDYDVCLNKTVLNTDVTWNLDTNSDDSDTDIKNENHYSNTECKEMCNSNVEETIASAPTKDKSKQEVNESLKEITKEAINNNANNLISLNITEKDNYISKDCETEIKKSVITKVIKKTSDNLNDVDKLDSNEIFKTESSVKDSEGISDYIEVPNCSENIEIDAENVTLDPKYTCTDCKYTGCYKKYIDHTISCTNKHISCIYCMKRYQNINSFLAHYPEHKLTYLSCPQCMEKFNNILCLKDHILTHIYGLFNSKNSEQYCKNFICSLCEESVDIDNFFIHWESHLQLNEGSMDDNEVELKKLMTPEMVKQAIVILSKIRNHNSLTCMVCDKLFTNSLKLKRHLIEHLLYEVKVDMLNGAKLRCPKCCKDIQDIDTWKHHMQRHSHLPTVFFCNLCPKSFKDSMILDRHKKLHKTDYNCDEKFFKKSSIVQHLANHEPINIMTCKLCGTTFRLESKLKHVCRPLLRFSCTHCERKFRTSKEKLNHLWDTHEFRYQSADCTLCDKRYRLMQDLRSHMMVKHGITRSDDIKRLRKQSPTKGIKRRT